MKTLKSILCLLLLSILISCDQNKEADDIDDIDDMAETEQSEAEIQRIIEEKNAKLQAWYKSGDIDSVAQHFAENTIQMPPNMTPLRGRENFKEVWKQNVAVGDWDFQLITQEVRACGNLATELGKYTLKFTPKEGSPIPVMNDSGNYVVLWEKFGDDWQIVWDAPVSEKELQLPVTDSTSM